MKHGRRLEIIKYLLTVQLNNVDGQTGEESNRRLRDLFLEYVEAIRPAVFFDIGARDGESAETVKRLIPECRAFAFEANPRIYSQFAERHRNDDSPQYHNLALSDTAGVIELHIPRVSSEVVIDGKIVKREHREAADTGRSSLLKRTDAGAVYDTVRVSATTLDRFCRDARISRVGPVAIWVDVEGAAALVLAGAQATLKRTEVIFIEVEGHAFWQSQEKADTVISHLIDIGFVPIARDREYHDMQFNVLLLRSDKLGYARPGLYDQAAALTGTKSINNRLDLLTSRIEALEKGRSTETATAPAGELTPVFIPVFNNPTFLRSMVEQLQARSFASITVLDNGSTYPPMLDLLDELSHQVQVRRFGENLGPRSVFTIPSQWDLMPPIFCLTDPDLAFNPDMPRDFVTKLFELSERHQRGKVGLALDISDPSSLRDEEFVIGGASYKAWEWEAQFWEKELEPGVYDAPIDTTFALYNKRFFDPAKPFDALRVAGSYTCDHLPWRRDCVIPRDELNFYQNTNVHSFYFPNARSGPPS